MQLFVLSPSTVSSRCMQVVACVRGPLPVLAERHPAVCRDHLCLIRSSADGRGGHAQALAAVSAVAENRDGQTAVRVPPSRALGNLPRSGVACLVVFAAFSVLRDHRAVFQCSYTISHPTSEWPGPRSARARRRLRSGFWCFQPDVPVGARQYLTVVWAHVSRVMNQAAEQSVCTFEGMIRSQRCQQLLPGRGMLGWRAVGLCCFYILCFLTKTRITSVVIVF